METRAANAFKLLVDGENLVLEFGAVVRDGARPGPAAVAVSDQIILPVDIGRRLTLRLEESLKPHAASLRAEQAKALSPAEAARAARPGASQNRPPSEGAGDRAAELLRMVGDLGVPYLYERSFRMCERTLLANRFLLTLDSLDIPGDARGRVLKICDRLSMPGSARQEAMANFETAKCVHFGFEAEGQGYICKLYLERETTEEEQKSARDSGAPVLLHLAFKWDSESGHAATSRYWWRPSLSAAGIEERLAHVYRKGPQASFDIARAALKLTEGRVPAQDLQYLEVEEAENARYSFDLNMYNAKLQVKDLQPLLHRMREHFEVRPGQFQALYDQIKTKMLGHLAGGIHRKGEDFFNIYYGVVGLPHFHGGFDGSATTSSSNPPR